MRTMLIGRKHGEENWQVIMGPERHVSEQIDARQAMLDTHPVNDVWAQVELWQEDLVKSKTTFLTADDAKREVRLKKANDKAFEKARAEAEAREKEQADKIEADQKARHEAEVARINEQHAGFAKALRGR